MSDPNHGNETATIDQALLTAVKAEVLGLVMAEVRPLLVQLAQLAEAKKDDGALPVPSTRALHEKAATRMAELQRNATERLKLREAQFQKRLGKMKQR